MIDIRYEMRDGELWRTEPIPMDVAADAMNQMQDIIERLQAELESANARIAKLEVAQPPSRKEKNHD